MGVSIMTNRFAANIQNRDIFSAPQGNSVSEALFKDAYQLSPYTSSILGTTNPERPKNQSIEEQELQEEAARVFREQFRESFKREASEQNRRPETNNSQNENKKGTYKERFARALIVGLNALKERYGRQPVEGSKSLANKAQRNSELGFGHHGVHRGRENVAYAPRLAGETPEHHAQRVIKMWENSHGHLINMLANSTKAGFGISGSVITLALNA
jgi:hypothetical protein